MLRVMLYGSLKKYGARFDLHVQTAAEALMALTSQIDGLGDEIKAGHYRVRLGKVNIDNNTLEERMLENVQSGSVLHIVPVVRGAGKALPFVMIVAGAALMVFSGGAAGPLLMFGFGLFMGGVTQLLSPTPKMPEVNDSKAGAQSSAFSNLNTNDPQGRPTSLIYGTIMVGTNLISQGVRSHRIDVDPVSGKPKTEASLSPSLWVEIFGLAAMRAIDRGVLEIGSITNVTTGAALSPFSLAVLKEHNEKITKSNKAFTWGTPLNKPLVTEVTLRQLIEVFRLTFNAVGPSNGITAAFSAAKASNQTAQFVRCYDNAVTKNYLVSTPTIASEIDKELRSLYTKVGIVPQTATDMTIKKTFTTPVAAKAPDGTFYNLDTTNDSVLAANYTAKY